MNAKECLNEIKREAREVKRAVSDSHGRCERMLFEMESCDDARSRLEREEAVRIVQSIASAKTALRQ